MTLAEENQLQKKETKTKKIVEECQDSIVASFL
jgi:hypothetical protein